jgi:aspartate-semialdehyde dehydrogenase
MSKNYNVAVAGATGAVGVEMLKTLEKRNFPVANLKLLASSRSAGKTMKFKGEDIVIEELSSPTWNGDNSDFMSVLPEWNSHSVRLELFQQGVGRS